MIPYFELKAVALGPIRLPVFGLLMVIAILTARWRMLRAERKERQPRERSMSTLFLVMLISGLFSAHVAKVALDNSSRFLADPFLVFRTSEGIRSAGGLYGGLLGGIIWCKIRGVTTAETLRRLDRVIFVLPVSWMIGRLGCALIHDHVGKPSRSWMAIEFPSGPAYDLGLIEFTFVMALSVLFWVVGRKPRSAGLFFCLFAFLYGGFRAWLDTLQVHPFGWDFFLGLMGQVIGLVAWTAMLRHGNWRQAKTPLAVEAFKTAPRWIHR